MESVDDRWQWHQWFWSQRLWKPGRFRYRTKGAFHDPWASLPPRRSRLGLSFSGRKRGEKRNSRNLVKLTFYAAYRTGCNALTCFDHMQKSINLRELLMTLMQVQRHTTPCASEHRPFDGSVTVAWRMTDPRPQPLEAAATAIAAAAVGPKPQMLRRSLPNGI